MTPRVHAAAGAAPYNEPKPEKSAAGRSSNQGSTSRNFQWLEKPTQNIVAPGLWKKEL